MELYNYFRSSASWRVRIALALKGVDYDYLPIHLVKKEQLAPEYVAASGTGLVPLLVTDDGLHLHQSLAIIEYLDETIPEPPLLPRDALGRARVRALAQDIACEIHPLNNLRTLRYLKKSYRLDDEGVNVWYRHWIAEGLSGLEAFLASSEKSGRYCYRNQVTIADCCLVPQVFNAQRYQCDLAPYPTVMGIFEECMKLDAFIDAQPSRQPDAA